MSNRNPQTNEVHHSEVIDEIDYTWRLDPFNHALPPFDRHITGIVDTLPIYLPTPHNWYLSTLFFQPKYKACVLKMQLGISLSWCNKVGGKTGCVSQCVTSSSHGLRRHVARHRDTQKVHRSSKYPTISISRYLFIFVFYRYISFFYRYCEWVET